MNADVVYYLWVAGLLLANAAAWGLTLFTLPGNWVIVGLTAAFAYCYPEASGRGVSWTVVGVLAGLAFLGELLELAAGAAGAAKHGASRRAVVLSLLGTVVGSTAGVFIGVPLPIVGSLVGAVAGGALGAFGGAYLGEIWKGKSSDAGVTVGTAAMIGRILGTVGKLAIGAVMFVIAAVDALL